jgi:citrate lyase alpha subunit
MIIHRGFTGMMETRYMKSVVMMTQRVIDFRWQPFNIILQRAKVASIIPVENKLSVKYPISRINPVVRTLLITKLSVGIILSRSSVSSGLVRLIQPAIRAEM